jgi:hypothetical protein
MITTCPLCKNKVKVGDPGHYRCPHCTTVFEFNESGTVAVEGAVAAPISPEQPPETASATGPICERCHHLQASEVCAECGAFVCSQCAGQTSEGKWRCHEHTPGFASRAPGELPPLWELFTGLLFRPAQTFGMIPRGSGQLGHALIFALVLGTFGAVMGAIYQLILPASITQPWLGLFGMEPAAFGGTEQLLATWGAIGCAPIAVVFGILFSALMLQLTLRILGVRADFSSTLKVLCYAEAPAVFHIIPVLGQFVFSFWSITLMVIGLAKMHDISYGRAAGAFAIMLAILVAFGLLTVGCFAALFSGLSV